MTSTKSTSARPIKKKDFVLKNRRDFIGDKHTPGCVFLFFLLTERWHSAVFVAGRHNSKSSTLRFRPAKIIQWLKFEQICCSRALLFFPVCFPPLFILFRSKWCCFFLLLLFVGILAVFVVRAGAFFAPRMLLCLCLWLTSTITWFSPFPPVFFLLFIIFLRH